MHPRLAVVGVLTMMATFGFGCSLQRHPIVDHAPEHSWTVVAVFAANSFSNPAVEVVVAPTCYHNHDVVNVQVFDESRNELLAQYRFGETNHIREPPPSALPMRKQTISYARFAIEPVIIRVEVRDASGVLLGCWHENLRVAL